MYEQQQFYGFVSLPVVSVHFSVTPLSGLCPESWPFSYQCNCRHNCLSGRTGLGKSSGVHPLSWNSHSSDHAGRVPSLRGSGICRLLLLQLLLPLQDSLESGIGEKEGGKIEANPEYFMLTHVYGIQKDGTDEPICRAAVEMQTQRTDCGHSGGRRGWDALREWHGDMYIII